MEQPEQEKERGMVAKKIMLKITIFVMVATALYMIATGVLRGQPEYIAFAFAPILYALIDYERLKGMG